MDCLINLTLCYKEVQEKIKGLECLKYFYLWHLADYKNSRCQGYIEYIIIMAIYFTHSRFTEWEYLLRVKVFYITVKLDRIPQHGDEVTRGARNHK